MKILSIESSCDETAAAITEDGRKVISSVIATQIDEHKLYGGVVPEIASRRHCENITGVCAEALEKADMTLDEIDAIAVTNAPGLIGTLLVGVNFAKGLALAKNKPLIAVHHIKGHIAANYITHPELEPPYLCLVVSGGHSHIVKVNSYTELETVGKTTDDAAGEAFDKAARAMGFQYPGGVHIDRAAKQGDTKKYKLPRPATKNPYDFSFSGLKTAVINLIHNNEQKGIETDVNSLAACFQDTITSILAEKFMAAADELGYISFDREAADLLFTVLSLRASQKSTIITSNLTFERWDEIFGDAAITSAIVDRLTYKAYLIDMEGDSYRLRETLRNNGTDFETVVK